MEMAFKAVGIDNTQREEKGLRDNLWVTLISSTEMRVKEERQRDYVVFYGEKQKG